MSTDKLPDGWTRVKFSAIAASITERVDDPSTSGVDRYVGLEHLDSESTTIRRWGLPSDVEATKLRFYQGDVIYGRRRAYQRKLGVADFDGICSAHALVLRAKPDVCLPEFLPYFLQSDAFHQRALDISVGSLSPTINWKTLAVQEFALPSIEEQRRVVELIRSSDVLVESLASVPAQADALVDSLAGELDALATAHIELGAVAHVTVGIVVKPADLYVGSGGVPALRSLNVAPGRLVWDEVVSISDKGHFDHEKSRLSAGDVVVVRSGRPGDAAVIPAGLGSLNAIDLLIVRCDPGGGLSPELLVTYLNSSSGRAQMLGRSAGTAQQHLNAGQLKQVRIPQLPTADQLRLSARVDSAKAVRRSVLTELDEARKLRSSLLARCLEA